MAWAFYAAAHLQAWARLGQLHAMASEAREPHGCGDGLEFFVFIHFPLRIFTYSTS